jgi:hypothetical protein
MHASVHAPPTHMNGEQSVDAAPRMTCVPSALHRGGEADGVVHRRSLHVKPGAQSVSRVQLKRQDPSRHAKGLQFEVKPEHSKLVPVHSPPVCAVISSLHPAVGHVPRTGAPVTGVQVPTLPGALQVAHGPRQPRSQQTPSTHEVERQSRKSAHGSPFFFLGAHLPRAQRPLRHSRSVVQVSTHAPDTHFPATQRSAKPSGRGEHVPGVGFVQLSHAPQVVAQHELSTQCPERHCESAVHSPPVAITARLVSVVAVVRSAEPPPPVMSTPPATSRIAAP